MANETAKKDFVLFEKRGRTAIITMNRPEAMNAYNREMGVLLERYWGEFWADPDLWTAIITGAGDKAYCVGMDLKDTDTRYAQGRSDPSLTQGPLRIQLKRSGGLRPMGNFPVEITKPMIAAINGYCFGGGLEDALGCDIRIAAEHATFEVSEVKRGMIPGFTPAVLPRVIHHNIAVELLLTGRRIDAQEAYRIGLVNKVVPLKDLIPTALAICDEINANAPLAVRAMKTCAWNGMNLPLGEAILQTRRMLHEQIYQTEDSREGVRAFVEKRKPVWKGR